MPYQEVDAEAELFLEHNGVEVFHVYKSDCINQGARTFWFGLDPNVSDEDDEALPCFDVRSLPCGVVVNPPQRGIGLKELDALIAEVIRDAIDTGHFDEYLASVGTERTTT